MALGRGEPNRRAPEIGFALGRRPALHQQFHNVQVTGPRRAVQRRPPVLIGRVYFSALAEQHLHHLVVAVRRRYVKPGFAVTVGAVQQLGRSAQQKTDHGDVAPETGQVQRIETVLRGSRLHLNHTYTYAFHFLPPLVPTSFSFLRYLDTGRVQQQPHHVLVAGISGQVKRRHSRFAAQFSDEGATGRRVGLDRAGHVGQQFSHGIWAKVGKRRRRRKKKEEEGRLEGAYQPGRSTRLREGR